MARVATPEVRRHRAAARVAGIAVGAIGLIAFGVGATTGSRPSRSATDLEPRRTSDRGRRHQADRADGRATRTSRSAHDQRRRAAAAGASWPSRPSRGGVGPRIAAPGPTDRAGVELDRASGTRGACRTAALDVYVAATGRRRRSTLDEALADRSSADEARTSTFSALKQSTYDNALADNKQLKQQLTDAQTKTRHLKKLAETEQSLAKRSRARELRRTLDATSRSKEAELGKIEGREDRTEQRARRAAPRERQPPRSRAACSTRTPGAACADKFARVRLRRLDVAFAQSLRPPR